MTVRIGMLTPSSNTCLEPVTYRLLTGVDSVTVHFSRLPVTQITLEDDVSAQFDTTRMLDAARLLADAKVDVVVWNGTAGSWLGVDGDRALAATLTEEIGVPATTSTLALLAACEAFGVDRLGLATPYLGEVAERIVTRYAAEGVQVVAEAHLGISDNESFARVPAEQIRRLVRACAGGGAQAVSLVCTNVPGAPLVAELEAEMGLPMFDSVTATLWQALELAGGGPASLPGWGALAASGWLRTRAQRVCRTLLSATGCDRTTVRLDLPNAGLGVDLTTAEATGPGVRAIRHDALLDQRRLNTVAWLDQHRRNLVQPDFQGTPRPPDALIENYGVRAQLLGPIERGGALVGWLSAHSCRERRWTERDVAAMDDARAAVGAALDELLTRS